MDVAMVREYLAAHLIVSSKQNETEIVGDIESA